MNVWKNTSRFRNISRAIGFLSLSLGCLSISSCRSQNPEEVDDRSPRQQIEDEFAGCPPLLPIDPAKGGWSLAPAAKYRVIGMGDVIMIRAIGRMDVTYDITLAIGKTDADVAAPAAAAGPTTKPAARKPVPASTGGAPVVYLYRRPPMSRLSGVENNYARCGHFRSATPVGFVSIRDADGFHSMAIEPAKDLK